MGPSMPLCHRQRRKLNRKMKKKRAATRQQPKRSSTKNQPTPQSKPVVNGKNSPKAKSLKTPAKKDTNISNQLLKSKTAPKRKRPIKRRKCAQQTVLNDIRKDENEFKLYRKEAEESRFGQLQEENEREDIRIGKLEKSLGIRKNRKKYQQGFYDAGLDTLLDICKGVNMDQENAAEIGEAWIVPTSDVSVSVPSSQEATEDVDMLDDLDTKTGATCNNMEYDLMNMTVDSLEANAPSEIDMNTTQSPPDSTDSGMASTDTKCFLVNKSSTPSRMNAKATPVSVKSKKRVRFSEHVTKISPEKKRVSSCISEEDFELMETPPRRTEMSHNHDLMRTFLPVFNRLSGASLKWALNEFQTVCMSSSYSRHDIKECFWQSFVKSTIESGKVTDCHILEHCALLTLIHVNIEEQFGLFVLHKLFNYQADNVSLSSTDELGSASESYADLNRMRVLAGLASLNLLPMTLLDQLFTDIYSRQTAEYSSEWLGETCFAMRMILPKIRKSSVYRSVLRAALEVEQQGDCPASPSSAAPPSVPVVVDKSPRFDGDQTLTKSQRAVMLIKHSLRNTDHENDTSSHVVKVMKPLLKRPVSVAAVFAGLNDIKNLSAEMTSPERLVSRQDATLNRKRRHRTDKLAKYLRMNTEVRRSILNTIISAEDPQNASEKLLAMKLTPVQQREIINVCIMLCLKERQYNPFYAIVLHKLCSRDRSYLATLRFRLWDRLNHLKGMFGKVENLVDLILQLIRLHTVNMSILKGVRFVTMDTSLMEFVRILITRMVDDTPECEFMAQIDTIGKDENLADFCRSIRLFMIHFILLKDEHAPTLKDKIRVMRLIQDAVNKLPK